MIKRLLIRGLCGFGRGLRNGLIAIGALAFVGGAIAVADYSATPGSGLTFASKVISSVHYAVMVICDATAGESQCAAINSSGQIAIQAPPSLPLPSGAATAANQATANTALSTLNTTLGSPFQAGGSVGQAGTWQVTPTVPTASTLTLTSTTTAYTNGQLVANNGTAASITNPSFSMPTTLGGAVPRLRLYSDDTGTGWQNATVQIDLWDAAPTWTNGDHGTWLPATGSAHHIGQYSCSFGAAVWGDGLATECTINQGNYASIIATTVYWSVEVTAASGNAVTASKHLYLRPELN